MAIIFSNMKEVIFNISDLLQKGKTDQISGRSFGNDYSTKIRLMDLIDSNTHVKFIINDEVKAINDSFIKGLFSEVFKKYKDLNKIQSLISIESNDFFRSLFDKNWQVLQAIYNV
jgi:hypothetical protein